MKKFAIILLGLVLLALLVLVLAWFLGAVPLSPAAGNATAGGNATAANATSANATAGNATAPSLAGAGKALAGLLGSNATAGGNATAANATFSNATVGNATAAGPLPVPHDLVAGAYLSFAVANATLTDLRERGLAPSLFSRPDAQGQVWWEVHLGRFPDLAPAQVVADRLARDKGVWVRALPVNPAAKPVAAVKGPATVYLVSAGEYLTRYAADERVRELVVLGFEPCVVRTQGEGGVVWYAVAVGQAKTEPEAATLSAGLAAKTGLPGRVTAEDAATLAKNKLCE